MKNARYNVNFGYALIDRDVQGELPQLLMTQDEVKHWLCILNPMKVEEWFNELLCLNRKGKMFVQINESNMVKVIKIQRN